jgi:hypothetical protein
MGLTLGKGASAAIRGYLRQFCGEIPRGGMLGSFVWTPFLHAGTPLLSSSC